MLCLTWFQFALLTVGSALGLLLLVTGVCLVISMVSWKRYVRSL